MARRKLAPMTNTPDIDIELERVERRLQALVRELPRDQVLKAFAVETQSLNQHAGEQAGYIIDRLNRMLVEAGVIEDESPTG